MTYPVSLDETGKVAGDRYRLLDLPLSVFVNRDGVIKRLQLAPMTAKQPDEYVGEILK